MSSYVVDDKVINGIVSGIKYGCKYNRNYPNTHRITELLVVDTQEDAISLAQDLYEMNVQAVLQRYPQDTRESMPGPCNQDGSHRPFQGFKEEFYNNRNKVYDYLGEYLYQCDEGNIPETPLFKAISTFHDTLAHMMVRSFREEQRERTSGHI
jgi:hypothetical protein